MSLKHHLFKPKWRHRDPEVRRKAVASSDDPKLFGVLDTICLKDEDASVRAAAARRVSDLGVLQAALESEREGKNREVILQRLRLLTASSKPGRPSLESRLAVVDSLDDRELLERVAEHAPEPELRRSALAKIDRQGFLGDRAIADPDPEIRAFAAAAVKQHSTLMRVIGETRKTDKNLHQQLEERLHRELLEAGDPEAVRKEAGMLCARLEAHALEHAGTRSAIPAEIASSWRPIADLVPAELRERFRNIAARLEHAESATPEAPEPETPEPVSPTAGEKSAADAGEPGAAETPFTAADEAEETPGTEASEQAPAGVSTEAAAKEPKESTTGEAAEAAAEEPQETTTGEAAEAVVKEPEEAASEETAEAVSKEPEVTPEDSAEAGERSARERDAAFEKAGELLERFRKELEDGALHKALETRHELTEFGKTLKGDKRWRAIERQVSALHGRVRELRDWQHWSNDKIRKELIREMEALPKTDLHPDAILDRTRALQAQWKQLEKSEQIPGDKHYHAAPWMWRKFSAAGKQAFEATKPYLEKRDEIRDRHLDEARKLLAELRTVLDSEITDWPLLGKLLQRARREMRNLDKLPAKARKKTAGQLRKVLDKGNAAMKDRYAVVEKAKLRLVREAEQLAHLADHSEAIRQAKRLQAEWKAAGSLWRSRENKLWKAFREPLDPLFGKLESDRKQAREASKAQLEEQERLCAEFEKLLEADDTSLLEAKGKARGLKDQWRDIERPNQQMRKRFQKLTEDFDRRAAEIVGREADRVRQRWWAKARILHELEHALIEGCAGDEDFDKARADWPSDETEEPMDRLLERRLVALTAKREAGPIEKETAERARELCIQLEFLAGLPSPDEEKDQRMQYQVNRLSRTLAGEGGGLSAAEEARTAEQEWLKLPVLSPSDRDRFETRIKAALEEIYRSESV